MTVPETAVHEDRHAELLQDDIRASWNRTVVQSKTHASLMQKLADAEFRCRVTTPNATHHSRPGRPVNDIDHRGSE